MEREGKEEAGWAVGKDGVSKVNLKICESTRCERFASSHRYSQAQSKQAYAHMDMDLRIDLREKLDTVAPEYGLVELSYPSFTRAYGYRCTALAAADAVEGIEALLEAGTGIRIDVEYDGGKGGGEWFSGTKIWSANEYGNEKEMKGTAKKLQSGAGVVNGDEVDEMEESSKLEQGRNRKNFWVAYDALHE